MTGTRLTVIGYNLALVKNTAIKILSNVPFTIKVSAITNCPGRAKPISVDKKLCIAFSPEFLAWCHRHNRRPMANQIPIANVIDLDKHLTEYRKMLYNNSQANNSASIILH